MKKLMALAMGVLIVSGCGVKNPNSVCLAKTTDDPLFKTMVSACNYKALYDANKDDGPGTDVWEPDSNCQNAIRAAIDFSDGSWNSVLFEPFNKLAQGTMVKGLQTMFFHPAYLPSTGKTSPPDADLPYPNSAHFFPMPNEEVNLNPTSFNLAVYNYFCENVDELKYDNSADNNYHATFGGGIMNIGQALATTTYPDSMRGRYSAAGLIYHEMTHSEPGSGHVKCNSDINDGLDTANGSYCDKTNFGNYSRQPSFVTSLAIGAHLTKVEGADFPISNASTIKNVFQSSCRLFTNRADPERTKYKGAYDCEKESEDLYTWLKETSGVSGDPTGGSGAPAEPDPLVNAKSCPQPTSAFFSGITTIKDGTYVIPKAVYTKEIGNISGLLNSSLLIPLMIDGKYAFRLEKLKASSLIRHLGFMQGDVINNLNGKVIKDMAQVWTLLVGLKNLKTGYFGFQRNGVDMRMKFYVKKF